MSFIALINFACLPAEAFSDRHIVKSDLIKICKRWPIQCRSVIAEELALAAQLGKTPEGLALALGLADAIAAISLTNPTLGLQLTTLVAGTAPDFVQSAVASALGTTSSPTSGSDIGTAGSAG